MAISVQHHDNGKDHLIEDRVTLDLKLEMYPVPKSEMESEVRYKICLPTKGCVDHTTCSQWGWGPVNRPLITEVFEGSTVRPSDKVTIQWSRCGRIWNSAYQHVANFPFSDLLSAGKEDGKEHVLLRDIVTDGVDSKYKITLKKHVTEALTGTCSDPLPLSAAQKEDQAEWISELTPTDADGPSPDRDVTTLPVVHVPENFDLRNVDGRSYMNPPSSQNRCGMCTAFAAGVMVESTFKKQFDQAGLDVQVSKSFIHSCVTGAPCSQKEIMKLAKKGTELYDKITKPKQLLIAMRDKGWLASEQCFGLQRYKDFSGNNNPVKSCAQSCPLKDDEGIQVRIGSVEKATDNLDKKIHIKYYGPMLASMTPSDAYLKWQTNGKGKESCEPFDDTGKSNSSDSHRPDHAVVIIGWGVSALGKEYWLVQDSRGATVCGGSGVCKVAMGDDNPANGNRNPAGMSDRFYGVTMKGTYRKKNEERTLEMACTPDGGCTM